MAAYESAGPRDGYFHDLLPEKDATPAYFPSGNSAGGNAAGNERPLADETYPFPFTVQQRTQLMTLPQGECPHFL
jgi:hypothetical protein